MTKQKIKIEKLTEVKITKLTPDELRAIAKLKTVLNEKTAAGLFRKILMNYESAINDYSFLYSSNVEFNELKRLYKRMIIILNK